MISFTVMFPSACKHNLFNLVEKSALCKVINWGRLSLYTKFDVCLLKSCVIHTVSIKIPKKTHCIAVNPSRIPTKFRISLSKFNNKIKIKINNPPAGSPTSTLCQLRSD